MCGSMVDIHSVTAEIRRGKKKKERRRNIELHRDTMAITLSILGGFAKFFSPAKSSKFPRKPILGYPRHLKYVAALPWKT